MNSWYHELRGRYDIVEKNIGINFGTLIDDPLQTDLTVLHEGVHSLLAVETEFGQATHIFYKLSEFISKVDDNEVKAMAKLLYNAQYFVQEGFATLMQFNRVKNQYSLAKAEEWASKSVHPVYFQYLQKLLFSSKFSSRYRDLFTQKITYLAMETGIRKMAKTLNLFGSSESLKAYLLDENNVPDSRLEKLIETIQYKNWLVTKPFEEIARVCGITYYSPSSKEDVASFLTYSTSLTNNPRTFTVNEVGDTPPGSETLKNVYENMLVANLDLKFSFSDILQYQDFLHYADRYEVVLAVLNKEPEKNKEFSFHLYGEVPEVLLYGFLGNGEKYVTATTRKTAETILNENLKDTTLAVKWGGYNPEIHKHIWSDILRPPNLIIYHTPTQMKAMINVVLRAQKNVEFEHLYALAMEGSSLQTLFVKVNGHSPIHAVNHLGNRYISECVSLIKEKSKVMNKEFLLGNKKHINNYMALWMGLFWEVDWVETMLDKEIPHFRK